MIKCVIGVALLVSLVSGASLYGGANVNGGNLNGGLQGPGANISAEAKVRGFKAVLYLFAPDSWINAWNAVPEAGQECFIEEASDPANADVYNSGDVTQIKQQVQTACPTGATEIGAFIDASEATFKSLPATFLADSKAWAAQAQTLGEQLKQAGASSGGNIQQQLGSSEVKQQLAQFSTITANFIAKVAAYSDADRQQIAAAFTKLQAFISGPQAVEFLTEASALYKTLGSGTTDTTALKAQLQQLKPTLQAIWQQYKTQNAEGLKQAGQLLGKDLTQADSMFNTQTDGAVNPNGIKFGGQQPGQVNQISQGVSNAIAQPVEQGKETLSAGGDKVQQWLQNAKQNTQEGWNDVKERASQGVQQLKEKVNEFKQQHSLNGQNGQASVNGQTSVNGNSAAAGLNFN